MVAIVAGSVTPICAAGTAQADETNHNSYNGDGSRITVVDVGQVDDPAEDVLEHFLHFGNLSEGPETPEAAEPPDPVDVPSVATVPTAYR
jgi:hypothetical protein